MGLLVIVNESSEAAFTEEHARVLKGIRECAISSVFRAKTLKDVTDAQKALLLAAYTSGMAEIAARVLHNVGNVLNSIQVSAQIIHETASRRRERELLERVINLLKNERESLGPFFAKDERGVVALRTMEKIAASWRAHSQRLRKECDQLQDELFTMSGILRQQQGYVSSQTVVEEVDLNRLAEETLELSAYLLKEHNITVRREFQPLPPLALEKSKFRLTLLCLLENASEAIRKSDAAIEGQILLRTFPDENGIFLELVDNGAGIVQEKLDEVLKRGFTTKPEGQGMGLHYATNLMNEVSGSIQFISEGPGKGATVRLFFPLRKAALSEKRDKPNSDN